MSMTQLRQQAGTIAKDSSELKSIPVRRIARGSKSLNQLISEIDSEELLKLNESVSDFIDMKPVENEILQSLNVNIRTR